MRIVAREDGDVPRVESHRLHPVHLDDQPARADVVIAHQLLGNREERFEVPRRELRADAEFTRELTVDDDSAAKAKGAQDLVENVQARPPLTGQSGVSVKLSGSAIILANVAIA